MDMVYNGRGSSASGYITELYRGHEPKHFSYLEIRSGNHKILISNFHILGDKALTKRAPQLNYLSGAELSTWALPASPTPSTATWQDFNETPNGHIVCKVQAGNPTCLGHCRPPLPCWVLHQWKRNMGNGFWIQDLYILYILSLVYPLTEYWANNVFSNQ